MIPTVQAGLIGKTNTHAARKQIKFYQALDKGFGC